MFENNKGNVFQLPVILMGLFMVICFLTALLPAFTEILNQAQGSNSLNCAGYIDTYSDGGNYTYNSTIPTSTISCMAVKLYVPYIVLGVLIASVAVLFGQKIQFGGQDSMSGGQQQYY
jgi:hypothetical protein